MTRNSNIIIMILLAVLVGFCFVFLALEADRRIAAEDLLANPELVHQFQ